MPNPFRRTKKPKEITLYPSKNMVMVTSETDIRLKPCQVLDDHKIKFDHDGSRKEADIKADRPAHILDLSPRDFLRGWRQKIFSYFFDFPTYLTFRVYTIQAEGEVTHDPHLDKLDEKQKVRFEKLLQLKAIGTKADIAGNIMKGLKGKLSWWETLGWGIIIAVVVFLFLFAFQIQPNM